MILSKPRKSCSIVLIVLLITTRPIDAFERGVLQWHVHRRHQLATRLVPSPTVRKQISAIHAATSSPSSSSSSNQGMKPPSYNWTSQSFAIAVPALIGMLVDPLLSLMDTAYVGRVGSLELAALGASTSIFHLAFNAFRATTAATTSLVASSLQESEEAAQQVTSISLQFSFWIGVGVMLGLLIGGNHALSNMGVSRQSPLYPAAAQYLFTRCWAAPVVLLIGVAEGAFRGYGNAVVPLTASLAAAFINFVLDPVLMFRPINWGVRGAAAATALSQVGAAVVYGYKLLRNKMLPIGSKTQSQRSAHVIRTIIGANCAMMMKQGSLLFAWVFAAARATRLGAPHVAAHQIALSIWLVFALILDGTAVSAQVLMSRAYAAKDRPQVQSLTKYMVQFALLQGVVSMLIVDGLDLAVPTLFTKVPIILEHVHKIMPFLGVQQILVSCTLVLESLAVGANQFRMLAFGTALSTVLSVLSLSRATSVESIWEQGIVILFAGRCLTAILASVRSQWQLRKEVKAAAS